MITYVLMVSVSATCSQDGLVQMLPSMELVALQRNL